MLKDFPGAPTIALLAVLMVAPGRMMAQQAAPPLPPPGCGQNCANWVPTRSIDFSSQHAALIRNQDGTLMPMDEPYFRSTLIAPGTWQILSDGDFSYLIEGDNEALAIDSTNGAGNIRDYMQTLTKKPVRHVANTHDHFDHTANNSYFDRAYMSSFTWTRATVPSATFDGINFPRNYPVTVIGQGYVFHLGNRDIEVISAPNHTLGDLTYLDRKSRILFAGDVFSQVTLPINADSNVAQFAASMRNLQAHRREFNRIAGGFRIEDGSMVDKCLANAEYILSGHEGVIPQPGMNAVMPEDMPGNPQHLGGPAGPAVGAGVAMDPASIPAGTVIYTRHLPHGAGVGGRAPAAPNPNQRRMVYNGCVITYDIRHLKE